MDLTLRLMIGAVVAAVIAAIARRAGSLSNSGAVAATVVGTSAVGAGWNWGVLLIAYFVSSTLLSRLGRKRKLERTAGMIDKTGPRDAMQVLSNGLPFTILACVWMVHRGPWGNQLATMSAAATSLAASAADTWATEIGTWVGHSPRSILNWRRLPVGQSGGVTIAGLFASLGGAAFVAVVASLLGWDVTPMPLTIIVGGLIGALADSLLGAIVQQRRWCDACAKSTEMHVHDCGAPTRQAGGWAFMTNDAVNLLATTVGALFGLMFTPGIAD